MTEDFCKNLTIEVALDYGTGAGVALPFLSKIARRVVAIDQFIVLSSRLCKAYDLQNVELHEIDTLPIPLDDEIVDLILCIDVLEHIESLPKAVKELVRVLKPGGKLIVSGPSENIIYKFGKLLAGFHERSVYHHWNIDDVNKVVKTYLTIVQRKTLPWPVRLFDIVLFQKPIGKSAAYPKIK